MARLQFCDYHNMVTILETGEHNIDFHPMVDFIEASPLRYALTVKPTVYVSHIRQFWSTTRIETTEEGTQILATVDGIHRTVTESSLMRNLKLKDKEGISSLPDTELFENLTLMGYNISPNQKFTFQKGFNEFSSNIATALICLATNKTYNFSKMIFDGLVKNVNNKGEGSGTPTDPQHTPSPKAQSPSHTTHTSPSLPPVTTTSILTVTPTETTPIRQYTRRARIAQSSALPTIADEPASPQMDVSQGEACPTDSGFIADQDRETIDKSSSLPHDSAPQVTSPLLMRAEVEINTLKERVKMLEDKEGVAATRSRDDALIKGRSMDEREEATERISDDSVEMATVLTSMDAATVLASGVVDVSTGSESIPTSSTPAEEQVPTSSDVVPTASLVFATVVTPYRRRKGKEEYHQFASELPMERRIELITDLVKYQDNYAKIYKYQSQQRKPMSKKQKRDYYMAVIRNNLGWKVKDFRGMTFEEVETKFNSVWKQMEDFIPMGSKEESERIKRKGLSLEQESAKKQKTPKEVLEEAMSPEEVPEEKNFMHAPVEWKLYDTCGVHHVTSKDKEIFMLVEKDYPLRKGLALVMISYKLQVENYLQMANDLILKIYKIANSPRQQAQEMWEAIERLQQGESLNIQDVKTNLFWEFGKFTSRDGETMEYYYTKFYKLMNEMIRNNLTVAMMQVNVQFLQQLQPEWSRYKGKEIAKPITPPSETASKEDSDPEQAQRDKDMQKNLALIAKKPKRVKHSAYHKEKMLCKQAEQGVPLQAKQYDWLADTNEEIDEQELEAHYSYMSKIQEVPTTDSGADSKPLEQVQNDARYNVFANDLQHSEQSKFISNTCLVETDDSKTEFEKYKAFNDRTVDYGILKRKLNETLGQLAQKDIEIIEEEAKRHKRKGIRFDQESSKKLKSSEEVIKDVKSTEEIHEEKIKEMMQLVHIEEVYVQALQIKHPIIDWKVHTEGQRSYWKIIRLGGSSACYQFFIDLLKQPDREDLNQLWALVKEYLSIRPATSEKEMELWVELKRLYEPDPEDQLWSQTQNFMHAPVEWKLYDLCGVHQVTAKDKDGEDC
nr:hypothetical protein [Tanacetum cinerariifolium]